MQIKLTPPLPGFINHKEVPFLTSKAPSSNGDLVAIAMAIHLMASSSLNANNASKPTNGSSLWYQVGLAEGISRGL